MSRATPAVPPTPVVPPTPGVLGAFSPYDTKKAPNTRVYTLIRA